MTISKGIKEKISALSDGELSDFETRRVLDEININPELREYWKNLQISKVAFNNDSLAFETSDISSAISSELGKSINSSSILQESFLAKQKNYIGIAVASCLLVLIYNVQTFNVSLSPIDSSSGFSSKEASRIAYLRTKDGVFVISVSGNITTEKKLEILQNANFFANSLNK